MTELDAARRGDQAAFARLVEPFRRELRAHCYRMSGSIHDADDLLQDSLLRAWRGLAGFQGRASLRTWLYKVTTHACLDQLERRAPRLLPADLGPAVADPSAIGPPIEGAVFVEPCPRELYEDASSPEAKTLQRESVALAFLVALQLLTPKQRAALIMFEVVGLEASECAELLDTSIASVNSALQRAREVLKTRELAPRAPEPSEQQLLARYVDAWERADSGALVSLLRHDATLAMPPLRDWLAGASAIGAAIEHMVFAPARTSGFAVIQTEANGQPAFAVYAPDGAGAHRAMGLHLVESRGGMITAMIAFVSPTLFAKFGLPDRIAP
jgi:RNA polymerase sigma-70 factor (ECF subfamily)